MRLATPLDGQLEVKVTLPAGARDDVTVLNGAVTAAQALWSGLHEKTLTYSICGQRSLLLRVVRRGTPQSLAVQITQP
jgi:hypothetical protein